MTSTFNYVELTQEDTSREMSSTSSLGLSLFLTACASGWWFYELYLKSKQTDARVQELEHVVHEVSIRQDVHAENLHDQDIRLREKRNYDESEELQEGKYQAWRGHVEEDDIKGDITIYRKKISSYKKNQEWMNWTETDGEDSSCVVRDFYLGNLNPEFHWAIESDKPGLFRVNVRDTFVNGWDSVIELEINLVSHTKDSFIDMTEDKSFNGDNTINEVLKKAIKEKRIHWYKILIGC
jgi:hypothetical protein